MRRWYQQFYVDVADVTPDMTDRFEIEVDTTAANEKWHVEVEENLKTQADEKDEKEQSRARELMTPRKDAPDVDQLARSMLLLHGVHDDDDHAHGETSDQETGLEVGPRHRLSATTVPRRYGRPPRATASAT